MDDFSELLGALPSEEFYESSIPPALPDAKTVLCSLPPELLLSIMESSKNKDVLSLMRANRLLYAVGLRRFYEVAYVLGARYHSLSNMDVSEDIDTLLPKLRGLKLGVVTGLLQNRNHIACLQHLHLISVPLPWTTSYMILSKILRYILENATIVNKIKLPTLNIYESVIFENMKISQNLQSLTTRGFSSRLVQTLLSQSNLSTLQIDNECITMERLEDALKHMSSTLKSLQCTIHIAEGEPDNSLEQIDCFASTLRRLENLEYGYCRCTIGYERTKEETLDACYVRLARRLSQLQRIVITDRDLGDNMIQNDKNMVHSIAEANEGIREIGVIRYHLYYSMDRPGTTIVWRKPPLNNVGRGVTKKTKSQWLPYPVSQETWNLWFDVFANLESARDALAKTFGDFSTPDAYSVKWAYECHLRQPKSHLA
ncbi:hypothetical protein FRB91_009635 [Serendipita sp. 411]|nr:hypothetical protein FRB91_009635 [Serendipita sp. 411]KAG9056630.1 hypothetical protein FS842_010150 [Serendipita sp. 407]